MRNVKDAQELSGRFLRALHHKKLQYACVMGYGGTIHYHIACKGPKPSKKWVKEKWHRLSSCYVVEISDTHLNIPWYLIEKNAAILPNHKEGLSAWDEHLIFQKIRTTSNLFPKSKKPVKGQFEIHYLSDDEIEKLERSESAQ